MSRVPTDTLEPQPIPTAVTMLTSGSTTQVFDYRLIGRTLQIDLIVDNPNINWADYYDKKDEDGHTILVHAF